MTATLRGASVAQARRALAEHFRAAGIDTPELDARVLIGHALGLDHAGVVSAATQQLSDLSATQIERFAQRRLAGEPVARIVGQKEFWGLVLDVTPAVLVPRPETESVVEAALALIDIDRLRTQPLRIADIGTGSGAILLALLSELPNAHGIGTDIDIDALNIARANAQRLGFHSRADFLACDFSSGLLGPFDLIVSNPPYIASGDLATLAREVREHDPHHALDGGSDGLAAYRIIAADAARLLLPAGHLVVELGRGQAEAVAALFHEGGLAVSAIRNDLAGIARAMTAKRRP